MGVGKNLKLVIIFTVAIVIAGKLGWLGPVENFLTWATRPVFVGVRSVSLGIANGFSNVFRIGDLREENAELYKKIMSLETENAQLKTSLAEYGQLETALNLKSRSGFELTAGRVVSIDPTSLNQTLLIDRGSQNGVVADQAVIDAEGAYIGRVTRVLRNTAEVTLISDVRSRIPSEVADSGARGIIQGKHGLSISLVEVPQGQNLPSGGRVVTTGFTPGVPAGLLIGHIDRVTTTGSELFQEAIVTPASNLRQLRVIFVITGNK